MRLSVLDQYGDIGGGQQVMLELAVRLRGLVETTVLAPPGAYLTALDAVGVRTVPWRPGDMGAAVAHVRDVRPTQLLVNGGRALPAAAMIRMCAGGRARPHMTYVDHSFPSSTARSAAIATLRTAVDAVAPVAASQVRRRRSLPLPGLGLSSTHLSWCTEPPDDVAWGGSVKAFGRLDPVKGLDVLAAAVPLLRVDGDVVVAVRPGLEDRSAAYESQVRAALADVLVDGPRDASWFEPGDIVVISSRNETVCLTAHEAMIRGAVVVAPSVGDLAGLIDDGASGFLYRPGDPAGLAAAVGRAAGLAPAAFASVARAGRAAAMGRVDGWYDAMVRYVTR